MATRTIRRYSEAVKHHVVTEIEAGRLSVSEAQRRFGIRGNQTVYNWLNAFGKSTHTATKVFVQMKDEQDPMSRQAEEIRQLKAEKQALESALAQSQVKVLFLESLVTVAERHVGVEAGHFKKNFAPKPSTSPARTPEKR